MENSFVKIIHKWRNHPPQLICLAEIPFPPRAIAFVQWTRQLAPVSTRRFVQLHSSVGASWRPSPARRFVHLRSSSGRVSWRQLAPVSRTQIRAFAFVQWTRQLAPVSSFSGAAFSRIFGKIRFRFSIPFPFHLAREITIFFSLIISQFNYLDEPPSLLVSPPARLFFPATFPPRPHTRTPPRPRPRSTN
jgi:hypothetical protein